MKHTISDIDQLRMLPGCLIVEEVDTMLEVPQVGLVPAEQIVEAEGGIVGVKGSYDQLDVRKSEESVACFRIVAIAPDISEKWELSPGDKIIFSALLRFFTPVQVGLKELRACYVEDGSILAVVN